MADHGPHSHACAASHNAECYCECHGAMHGILHMPHPSGRHPAGISITKHGNHYDVVDRRTGKAPGGGGHTSGPAAEPSAPAEHPQKAVYDKLLGDNPGEGLVQHKQSRQIVEQMEAHGWKITGQSPQVSLTKWEAPDGRQMTAQFLTDGKTNPKFYPGDHVTGYGATYKAALAHVVTPTHEEVSGPSVHAAAHRVSPELGRQLHEQTMGTGRHDDSLRALDRASRQLSGYGGTTKRPLHEVTAGLREHAAHQRKLAQGQEEYHASLNVGGSSSQARMQRERADQHDQVAAHLENMASERQAYETERDRRAALPLDIRPTARSTNATAGRKAEKVTTGGIGNGVIESTGPDGTKSRSLAPKAPQVAVFDKSGLRDTGGTRTPDALDAHATRLEAQAAQARSEGRMSDAFDADSRAMKFRASADQIRATGKDPNAGKHGPRLDAPAASAGRKTHGGYEVGQQVEVLRHNFDKPGFPEEWEPGTIASANKNDHGLLEVGVKLHGGARDKNGNTLSEHVLVGPRGGNKHLRAASQPRFKARVVEGSSDAVGNEAHVDAAQVTPFRLKHRVGTVYAFSQGGRKLGETNLSDRTHIVYAEGNGMMPIGRTYHLSEVPKMLADWHNMTPEEQQRDRADRINGRRR